MKNIRREIQTKDGRNLIIRTAEVYDAQKLMNCVKTYLSDSDFIRKYPDEFALTLEQEIGWIQSFQNKENSLLLVAEYNGEIVGNVDVTGHTRRMMQHTAVIGMGILSNWRNSGLGSALMETAINWAKNCPQLELLWLQVYTDNVLVVNLYKKMGFKDSDVLEKYFKQNGRYQDMLTMVLDV